MTISETAHEAAEAAGKILADYFHNGVTMRTKSASVDLVSDADWVSVPKDKKPWIG